MKDIPGWTARDEFAAHAPIGIELIRRQYDTERMTNKQMFEEIAKLRYQYADAMMKQRDSQTKEER